MRNWTLDKKCMDTFDDRYDLIRGLLYKEQIYKSPQAPTLTETLARTLTVAYQTAEPVRTLTMLLHWDGVRDNFLMFKLIHLYLKWDKEYGHILRVYNKEKKLNNIL